jgi:hypothetical protein
VRHCLTATLTPRATLPSTKGDAQPLAALLRRGSEILGRVPTDGGVDVEARDGLDLKEGQEGEGAHLAPDAAALEAAPLHRAGEEGQEGVPRRQDETRATKQSPPLPLLPLTGWACGDGCALLTHTTPARTSSAMRSWRGWSGVISMRQDIQAEFSRASLAQRTRGP